MNPKSLRYCGCHCWKLPASLAVSGGKLSPHFVLFLLASMEGNVGFFILACLGLIQGVMGDSAPDWRPDGRCGSQYPLDDGRPGQCDPNADENGKGPCCSPFGWCGNSRQHCPCSGCTDFRQPGKYMPVTAFFCSQ